MKAWKSGCMVCAIGVLGPWAFAYDIKGGRMTAKQVANAFKNTNQALSQGISAAERHVGGNAVDAECFGAAEGGQGTICMVTVLTKDNKLVQAKVSESGQILGQNNLDAAPGKTPAELSKFNQNDVSVMDCIKAAERHVAGSKAVQVEALSFDASNQQAASCNVTVLTNDDKLVETTVTKSGQVLGHQNVESIMFGQGFAVAPGITTERTTMAPTATDRTAPVIRTSEPIRGESASADDFAMPKRYQKASDLIGKNVTNTANENLGELNDIVLDASSGRILYGVLSFGGFLGLGDKLFAIPWPSIRLAPDFKSFVLHVEKDRLKDAQGFDKKQWPNFADDRWATTTFKHYNQTPYWENTGKSPAMGSPTDGSGNFRDRWYQKVTNWQKASDLIGKDVHNTKNEDIGKISNLAVDPDSGRILYGVLSFRGKLFPVPFNAMNFTADGGKKIVLNIDKEALKDSIAFTDKDWPNMVDPTWSTTVHTTYNVQPYWLTSGTDMNRKDITNPNRDPSNPSRPNERP